MAPGPSCICKHMPVPVLYFREAACVNVMITVHCRQGQAPSVLLHGKRPCRLPAPILFLVTCWEVFESYYRVPAAAKRQ